MSESRESFLARFRQLPFEQQARIELAYIVAKCEHHWQTRRQGGRYFDHPRAAALIYVDELAGMDPDIVIALELHDLVEDTKYATVSKVQAWFGDRVAFLVDAVTKREGEKKRAYYQRMADAALINSDVVIVKGCDNLHNLRSLDDTDPEFVRYTVEKSHDYIFPMVQTAATNELGCGLGTRLQSLRTLFERQYAYRSDA